MFSPSLSTKCLIAFVVVLILGGLGYAWQKKDDSIIALNRTNAVQGVAVEKADQTIQKQAGSKAIDERTNVDTAVAVRETEAKHESIQRSTGLKIDRTMREYGLKPQTAENLKARDDAISTSRIDGLWSAYCETVPGAKECAAS